MHRPRRFEQRRHDAPGFLDGVLTGEEFSAPVQGVVEQPLVGLGVLPWGFLEENLEVSVLKGLFAGLLGKEAKPGAGAGIDAHGHLVLPRVLAGADAEGWRAL